MPEPINPINKYLDRDERFYTSPEVRDFFKLLESNGIYRDHPDAFIASMSLGLAHEKFDKVEHKVDLMILPVYRSHDPNGIFPLLVKAVHPELEKDALARRMEEYAIYGAKMLKEQYDKLGKIDFQLFISLAQP